MSNKRKDPRRSQRRGIYSGNARLYTPIYDEAIRDTDAYKTLSPVQRLILFDAMRAYYRASCWDTINIDDCGFEYTYSMCRETVSAPAFYDAMKAIVARGWLKEAIHLQELRAGAAKKYVPSRDWERYQATPDEQDELRLKRNGKERRLSRDKAALSAFFANSHQQPAESGTRKLL